MLELIYGFDNDGSGGSPRFTGHSLGLNNNTSLLTLPGGSLATRIVGFAFNPSQITDNGEIIGFQDNGTSQLELRLTGTGGNGNLQVTRNGTQLGITTSQPLTSGNVWVYIEFAATIDPSAGSFEVRVNGITVLSGSGLNTRNTANSSFNQLFFVGVGSTNFDDVYVVNSSSPGVTSFLGDVRVTTVFPSADSTVNKDWTPNSGTAHFSRVNDNPNDGDTSFNSSNIPGQRDTYTFTAISVGGQIFGTQIIFAARADDAGPRQVSEVCRSGGANYYGALVNTLASSYQFFEQNPREVDPATGLAWTTSGINSAEFGVVVDPFADTSDSAVVSESVSLVRI